MSRTYRQPIHRNIYRVPDRDEYEDFWWHPDDCEYHEFVARLMTGQYNYPHKTGTVEGYWRNHFNRKARRDWSSTQSEARASLRLFRGRGFWNSF